jgi:hypothetical protein
MKNFIFIVFLLHFFSSNAQPINLSKEETQEYIRNRCIEDFPEGKLERIRDIQIKLEFEDIVIETYLRDNTAFKHRAALKGKEITYKYVPLTEVKLPERTDTFGGGYQLFIGDVDLPSLFFKTLDKTERVIKALNHLKSFCKKDPFK